MMSQTFHRQRMWWQFQLKMCKFQSLCCELLHCVRLLAQQLDTHAVQQLDTHAVQQLDKHAVQQLDTHAVQQLDKHAVQQLDKYAVQQFQLYLACSLSNASLREALTVDVFAL